MVNMQSCFTVLIKMYIYFQIIKGHSWCSCHPGMMQQSTTVLNIVIKITDIK